MKIIFLFLSCFSCFATYVSTEGSDSVGCGNSPGSDGCRTLAYASEQEEKYPKSFILTPGTYVENNTVVVNGTIIVSGQGQAFTFLSKENNLWSIILFHIAIEDGNLTVSNLTFILNNHTVSAGDFRADGGNGASLITLRQCCLKMNESLTGIYGCSFSILNTGVILVFDTCTVCNVSTIATYPFIRGEDIEALYIINSSFANVSNHGNAQVANGGCFLLDIAARLVLDNSLFVACSATHHGGVGVVLHLNSSTLTTSITSCSFWNISAAVGGALVLNSTVGRVPIAIITVTGSSFVNSTAVEEEMLKGGYGGCLIFGHGVQVLIDGCSFVRCACKGYASEQSVGLGGGAVCVYDQGNATFVRCVFLNCTAAYGGAVWVGSNSVGVLHSCVFGGNVAQKEENGNDLYFDTISKIQIENSYTEQARPCGDVIAEKDCSIETVDYTNISCSNVFSELYPPQNNGDCPIPCAYETNTNTDEGEGKDRSSLCGWPTLCSPGFVPVLNACVPACAFAVPVKAADPCTASCAVDASLGTDMCSVLCDTTTDETAQARPGSACTQQQQGGGGGGGGGGSGVGNGKTKKKQTMVLTLTIVLVVAVLMAVVMGVIWRCCCRSTAKRGYIDFGADAKAME